MMDFICCNNIIELKLDSENNKIKIMCYKCDKELDYYYNSKIELCRILENYLKTIKENIKGVENVEVGKIVKLIGKNKNKENVIAITKVVSYNKEQINKDLELIKNIRDKSIILGDDTPSLNLPFEEDGLVCKEIEIEILD